MDMLSMLALKKKGPGSTTSSIRSGKSLYKPKAPSSSHSTTSAMVREIMGQIPDKEKPQAEKLTKKIKEIKEKQQITQANDLFDELIVPYNREVYFDNIDDEVIQTVEENRLKKMNKQPQGMAQNTLIAQQKEPVIQTELVAKFQNNVDKMVVAFRSLRRMYFPNDLYRTISVKQWRDFEKEVGNMLNSAFLVTKIFIAKHIERLAYKELLGIPAGLPDSLSWNTLSLMFSKTDGRYMGELQGKIMDAFIALARIQRYRQSLLPVFHKFLELYRSGKIFVCNMGTFSRMFAELALYEDVDWQEFELLDLFLELMETPLPAEYTAMTIIQESCPSLISIFEKYEDFEEVKHTDSFPKRHSRLSSHSSISSVLRLNNKGALAPKKNQYRSEQTDNIMREQRLKDLQNGYKALQTAQFAKQTRQIQAFDQAQASEIVLNAARGLSRLMLPCHSVSFIQNIGSAKRVIYEEMLHRGLLAKFLQDPVMQEANSQVKRCLTTTIAMFVLQTTTESKYQGEHVIFYLKKLGILEVLSQWSKDPDLVVRGNAAWMFTALCIHHLVPPLELTKLGIIRDMFTLFIQLYKEPEYSRPEPEETENIATKILQMYDYDNFLDNIDGILNKPAKIQHLIFATLIFLSIYDDPNIISAVHKSTDKEVDKPVEENALCGLMELLQKDAEKMKLFIKILIQFTICDDDSFQQNGIWYLKHIIINSELNQLVESQRVDILDVFIAGSVCESEVIQQECVNVLTYLAIEKKAYQNNKEDPLLQALMYLTGVQFSVIRGLAYNGLAALALHGAYAADIIIKQAQGEDYYNTITRELKKFRQEFVEQNFKSDTVAAYAGINLLLNLSRSATPTYQSQVSERVFLILDTIAAQNQLSSKENMNEVGCLQTIRALMCSSELRIKEKWAVSFIERVAKDKSFRLYKILINSKFVPWCLNLLIESQKIKKAVRTASLLRMLLYEYYYEMSFEQEETNIRDLFSKLLQKYPWEGSEGAGREVNEKLVESCLLIFIREKNLILAVSEEVLKKVVSVIDTFVDRHADTKLALSKQLASTANLPQIQNLLIKKLSQTVTVILHYLDSSVYEEKFNAARVLVFLTKSPDFNTAIFQLKFLQKLCSLISYFDYQDLHPLVLSITNLLVFSRCMDEGNKFVWFFDQEHFHGILRRSKENDCHSLAEAFLDLMTKALVEREFQEKLFSVENKHLVKDMFFVLTRAVNHKCGDRCSDMSSRSYKFYVNCYSISWLNLKKHAFAVASQLIRMNQCFSKIKKSKIGQAGLNCFKKVCKNLPNCRTIDPQKEGLISELCIYLQLHYGILKDEGLAEELLTYSKELCNIIKKEKVADLLQARIGALLLHSSLTAGISNDSTKLNERITNILYTMTNSTLPELHNLAVWSLRQLFIKCSSSPPLFDYQDAFYKSHAVKSVVPKLVVSHRQVQENALLCLGSLFENKDIKQEFIDLAALPHMMYLGQYAFNKIKEGQDTELPMLAAFGSALSKIVDERTDVQDYLLNDYDLFTFTLDTLKNLRNKGTDQSANACQWFTLTLKNLLKNKALHESFLSISNDPLRLLSDLFHNTSAASYDQKQVDNNITHCYALLAKNPANHFHISALFKKFTGFVNKICDIYDKNEYLSKTEVDTHSVLLSTMKDLIYRQLEDHPHDMTDDDREDFLQNLNSAGGLEPLLMFEHSNVPEIREMASDVLERLAPSN